METLTTPPPDLNETIDPNTVDVSDESFQAFEDQFAEETATSTAEIETGEKKQGLFRNVGNFALKVAKGESLGTVIDVATIAAGVPLPVREAAGSAIDYKIYGDDGAETETKEHSKMKKLRKAIGTVALYSVSGMIASKYGSEIAGAMRDSLNDGTVGTYVTPLVAKLGAVFGVNAAVNKLGH